MAEDYSLHTIFSAEVRNLLPRRHATILSNGQNTVALPATNATGFFHLRK